MALYGLKISPLLWYKELTNTLIKFGLKLIVELEMQVKKIRNENSVLLQEAIEPHYIRYIVAKD